LKRLFAVRGERCWSKINIALFSIPPKRTRMGDRASNWVFGYPNAETDSSEPINEDK
jgi:hypothetical protein